MNPYKNFSDDELDREIEKKIGKEIWRKPGGWREAFQILEDVDPELFNEFADRIARGY